MTTTSHINITYPDGEVWFDQATNHGAIKGPMVQVFRDGFSRIADEARKADKDHRDDDTEGLNISMTATVDGAPFPSVSVTGASYRTAHEIVKSTTKFAMELSKHGDKRAAEKHAEKAAK